MQLQNEWEVDNGRIETYHFKTAPNSIFPTPISVDVFRRESIDMQYKKVIKNMSIVMYLR